MQQKRLTETNAIIKQRMSLILVLALCIAPLLTGRPLANRILLSAGTFAMYGLSLLFWSYFFPLQNNSKAGTMPMLRILPGSLSIHGRSIQAVKNGSFNPDYFALRSKPAIPALLIDEHSVVITKDENNKRGLLLSGLWTLNKNTTIVHVFDLRPAAFTYGPDSRQNPIARDQSHKDNLRSEKTLHIDLERTRCVTADGVELIPVLKIIYRAKHPHELKRGIREWLAFSAFLESANIIGNVANLIEDMIGTQIANHLKESIGIITWDQINQAATSREQLVSYFQHMIDQTAYPIDGNGQKPILPAAWRNMFITRIQVKQVWTR